MTGPLFRKVDCVSYSVADLERALEFYRDRLGHALIWRTPDAVGLRLPETDAELVLHTQNEQGLARDRCARKRRAAMSTSHVVAGGVRATAFEPLGGASSDRNWPRGRFGSGACPAQRSGSGATQPRAIANP